MVDTMTRTRESIVHKSATGRIKHGDKVAEQVKRARRGLTKTHSVASEAVMKCVSSLYRFQGSVQRKIRGGLAQLGERLLCTQEVSGSIPLISTEYGSLAQSVRALA